MKYENEQVFLNFSKEESSKLFGFQIQDKEKDKAICKSCEIYKNDKRTQKDLPCADCGKYMV